jgi:NAD-dependent deacetylase
MGHCPMESAGRNRILLHKKMKKLVCLSGAGVSAESGIATFRASDGLWEKYKIEEVATPQAWSKNPHLVTEFYNQRRRKIKEAQPNKAHLLLAQLQKQFDVTVITQNIDNLHERAGVQKVLHLHGEIFQKRNEHVESEIVPCLGDQPAEDWVNEHSRWRPNIVWFGEAVPMMEQAIPIVAAAEIFVVVGTSLMVYPAASLVEFTSPNCERFLIDIQPPEHISTPFTTIRKPATTGMEELLSMLS